MKSADAAAGVWCLVVGSLGEPKFAQPRMIAGWLLTGVVWVLMLNGLQGDQELQARTSVRADCLKTRRL